MANKMVQNGASWIKKNVAIVVALSSLFASVVGWYVSYQLLCYQVTLNSEAIGEIRTDVRGLSGDFNAHLRDMNNHTNREWRDTVMTRLENMDTKLDELMRRR